jgi:hypothetical protein
MACQCRTWVICDRAFRAPAHPDVRYVPNSDQRIAAPRLDAMGQRQKSRPGGLSMPSAHQSGKIFEMRSRRSNHQNTACLSPARAFFVRSWVITNGEKPILRRGNSASSSLGVKYPSSRRRAWPRVRFAGRFYACGRMRNGDPVRAGQNAARVVAEAQTPRCRIRPDGRGAVDCDARSGSESGYMLNGDRTRKNDATRRDLQARVVAPMLTGWAQL